MEKIVEYKLITGDGAPELEAKVQELLSQGFEPIGAPYIKTQDGFRNGYGQYIQAVGKTGQTLVFDQNNIPDYVDGLLCEECGETVDTRYYPGVYINEERVTVFCETSCFESWIVQKQVTVIDDLVFEKTREEIKELNKCKAEVEEDRKGLEQEFRERVDQATACKKEELKFATEELKIQVAKAKKYSEQLKSQIKDEKRTDEFDPEKEGGFTVPFELAEASINGVMIPKHTTKSTNPPGQSPIHKYPGCAENYMNEKEFRKCLNSSINSYFGNGEYYKYSAQIVYDPIKDLWDWWIDYNQNPLCKSLAIDPVYYCDFTYADWTQGLKVNDIFQNVIRRNGIKIHIVEFAGYTYMLKTYREKTDEEKK